MSMTNIDQLFLILNQILFEYRRTIVILSSTVLIGWSFNQFWINRRLLTTAQSIKGKTVLITGGNTGIGYETAKGLLQRGGRVIIACRNLDKGRQAIENLINENVFERENIRLMECDLCSLDSVRKFASLFNNEEERLDILICNAGLGYSLNLMTKDHFNNVIQVNYLSHFLLTNLLLDKLIQCRPSRILNISSDLHKGVKSINWSDAFTQLFKGRLMGAYAPSKLFQILSSYQLKEDLLQSKGVNTFAITPGLVSTSINDPLEESIGFFTSFLYYPLTYLMKFFFSKTLESGAQTSIYCAVEPSLEKCKDLYFQNCSVCQSSPLSTDPLLAQQLWTISREAVGLE